MSEQSNHIRDFIEGKVSLEDVWDNSIGSSSRSTFLELEKLENKIHKDKIRSKHINLSRIILSSACAVLLIVGCTFFITRQLYQTSDVEFSRFSTSYGETKKITLSDGTVVSLNSMSTLFYPSTFNKSSRTVYLIGEGNFSVVKEKSAPFIVKTSNIDVIALGTVFCVHAYPNERTVSATLKEGKLQVNIPSLDNHSCILDPDMQLSFTPSEEAVSLAQVNAQKYLDWENGYTIFRGAPFEEIAAMLERKYAISFSYDLSKSSESKFNVRFTPSDTLEESLKILTLLVPGSSYHITGDKVFFYFK